MCVISQERFRPKIAGFFHPPRLELEETNDFDQKSLVSQDLNWKKPTISTNIVGFFHVSRLELKEINDFDQKALVSRPNPTSRLELEKANNFDQKSLVFSTQPELEETNDLDQKSLVSSPIPTWVGRNQLVSSTQPVSSWKKSTISTKLEREMTCGHNALPSLRSVSCALLCICGFWAETRHYGFACFFSWFI